MDKINEVHRSMLKDCLRLLFGDQADELVNEKLHLFQWIAMPSGQLLVKEGDSSEDLYFVISGRLIAQKTQEDGSLAKIGEIGKGELIGEMGVITGDVRYAHVRTIRDSILVKLKKEAFIQILSANPSGALKVCEQVISRSKKSNQQADVNKQSNICFVPIHDLDRLCNMPIEIFEYLRDKVDIGLVEAELSGQQDNILSVFVDKKKESGITDIPNLLLRLNDLEAQNEFLFFYERKPSPKLTNSLIRQADKIILVADATQEAVITRIEQELELEDFKEIGLILVHPHDTLHPRNTSDWLSIRHKVKEHYHLRLDHQGDIERMGRYLSGRSTGLVLSGGASRGFSHAGVIRALHEFGIHIDRVGGTSAGAMMAALVAFQADPERVKRLSALGPKLKPTKDFSLTPYHSLTRGRKIRKWINLAMKDLCGSYKVEIEDAWIPYFAVAANLHQNNEKVFKKGCFNEATLASAAIPVMFPPVLSKGELIVDGGIINNFPADIMKQSGCKFIIGVDLGADWFPNIEIDKVPSNWAALRESFFNRKSEAEAFPSISSILLQSIMLASNEKRKNSQEITDLLFQPGVHKLGINGWKKFDKMVELGYNHAVRKLEKMSDEELKKFRI